MNLNNLPKYLLSTIVILMILFPYSGQSQIFEEMIDPSDHPLSKITIPSGYSAPFFCDTDRDGDMDLISGAANGQLYYYENIGTEERAIFDSIGIKKLFDDKTWEQPEFVSGFGKFSKPCGVDSDRDGDMDLYCGNKAGEIYFLKNRSGHSAPFKLEIYRPDSTKNHGGLFKRSPAGPYASPAISDFDYDDSFEMVVGNESGQFQYYELASQRDLFDQESASLKIINDMRHKAPCFGDVDNDGDIDMVIGNQSGDLAFYRYGYNKIDKKDEYNLFPLSVNPFSDIVVDSFSTPALVDIDSDGDLDLFVGQADGTIVHYKNVSINDYLTIDNHQIIEMSANLACNGSAVIYGNLGVGAMPSGDRLTVNGRVTAEDFNAEVVDPPDYVFAREYDLRLLKDVQLHIDEYSHLPEIPSAVVMERDGVDLGDMSMMLLKKIEELTLYILEQEKRIIALEKLKSN